MATAYDSRTYECFAITTIRLSIVRPENVLTMSKNSTDSLKFGFRLVLWIAFERTICPPTSISTFGDKTLASWNGAMFLTPQHITCNATLWRLQRNNTIVIDGNRASAAPVLRQQCLQADTIHFAWNAKLRENIYSSWICIVYFTTTCDSNTDR